MQRKQLPHRGGLQKALFYAKVTTAAALGAWLSFKPLVSHAQEKQQQEKTAPAPQAKVPASGKTISFSDAQQKPSIPHTELKGGCLYVDGKGNYLDVYEAMLGMAGNGNATENDVKCRIDNDAYMVVKTKEGESIEAAYTRCYVFERGVLAIYFGKNGSVSGFSAMPANGKYLGASATTIDKKAIFVVFSKGVLCFTDSGGNTVPFFKEAGTATLNLLGANKALLTTDVCSVELSSDGKYQLDTW